MEQKSFKFMLEELSGSICQEEKLKQDLVFQMAIAITEFFEKEGRKTDDNLFKE